MNYDFTTLLTRTDSIKWQMMKDAYPDIDAEAIPLTVADMEWKTAPEITEGLKAYLDSTILGYPYAKPSYYEAVQGWMQRRHEFTVEKEWIYPISGVVPAVYGAISALTNRDDGVIIMTPIYFPFFRAIADTGRKRVDCPLINENEQYSVDFDLFELLAAEPKNTMFILCSPHNPGGIVWSDTTLRRIDAICRRHDVLVLADEIHQDLIMPGYKHRVFQTLSDQTAYNTVTCTAPTKTFNLAGMGVSNLICANQEHREKIDAYKAKTGFPSVTILGYKACELAYTKADAWLDQAIEKMDENRQIAEDFFDHYFPDAVYSPLQGTYLFWVHMSQPDEGRLENAANKPFVALDGAKFGPGGQGHIRINLALPSRALEVQLKRLASDYNRI